MKGQGGGGTARGGGKNRSGGGTEKIVKTKARQTAAINDAIVKLRKAVFDDSGKDKDVCASMPAFMKFDRNGLDLEIAFTPKLSKEEADWAFEITRDNMEDKYDASGYGWDDDDKFRELTEPGARFLVVREWPEDEDAVVGQIVGFAHFRFSVQGDFVDQMIGEPSLLLWDIHIEEEYQRKGLSRHLMTILELIARREGMTCFSVPIQLADEESLAWISKFKGFAPDESLKSLIDFDPEMEGFQVFTKDTAPKKPTAAPVPAAAADAATASVASSVEVAATKMPSTPSAAKKSETAMPSPTSVADEWVMVPPVPPSASEEQGGGGVEEEKNEGGSDEAEISAAVDELVAIFAQQKGRDPTEEEIASWRGRLEALSPKVEDEDEDDEA